MSEFLAEASILIQANTVAFRKELAAALATVPKVVPINIVAVGGGTEAASAAAVTEAVAGIGAASVTSAAEVSASAATVSSALGTEAEAAGVAGAAVQGLAAAQAEALQINKAYVATETAVAEASLEVVAATSAQEAAQITLARQTAAGAAARELLTQAQLRGLNVEQLLQTEIVKTGLAMGAEAAAAEREALAHQEAAAAAAKHSIALRNVSRGAATSSLAAVGLRGATLTANAGFIAGAAAAITFGKAIQTAASFETSLNVFAATTGATAEQLGQVSEAAKQLGSDISLPGVTAQSAADAMLELAKAGLTVQDSIAGARGVLQLATAASIDNAEATQIAASALNAFSLSGDQAVHVADVLANAANLSQGSIADVGISLQQAAAVSRQVGVGFEDTVALLTELAQAGIRGSDAGTSLRVAFTRLINPTAKAQKVLNDLNVQIRDQAGNIKPSVFVDFANAQAGLSKTQQDANAAVVFGTDALRAYSIVARDGATNFNAVRDALDKQGTASDIATAKTKGTAGAFENLKNQGSSLLLTLGDALKGPATDAATILAGGIENINAGLEKLNQTAAESGPTFAELAQQAGKLNFAVAQRGADVGAGLAADAAAATKALEDQLPKALLAKGGIEEYAAAVHNAATESESLSNRIDEGTDRFARQATVAAQAAAAPPKAIGPTAKLDRRAALAAAEGNLPAFLETQQEALARAKTALAKSKGNVKQRTSLFDQVTNAQAAVATTERQISEKAASDAQQNADTIKQNLAKADQAILDAFLPAEQRLDVRQAIAEKSGAPGALKAVSIARKKQLLAEIKQIQDNFNDTKNAASLIAAKRVEIVNLDAKITENIQAIFTQGQQDRQDALDAQVNVAQAEGNIPLQIRLNNVLIAAINKKIASDKLVGKALNDAKAERATLQTANQGLRDQNIQNQIALGQSVADLTGNKDQLIAALDAAIAADRARVAALKKAGKSSTVVQTELNGFLQQRKEALKKATDDAKEVQGRGTTAFDLLKEANDTFNRNAGNLINPSQPFAGPTGFTADIAQFLIRRQQPTANVSTAKADFTAPLVSSNAELITVIKENTDALRGKSDKSGPVSSGRTTQHPRVWAADSFWARHLQEA